MTAEEILDELRALGAESIKKVLRNHGVQEPFFGVKIGDMKNIQKRIKKDYQLALDLYDTGNYDAMYLAGLVADDARMTRKDLNRWVKTAKGGASHRPQSRGSRREVLTGTRSPWSGSNPRKTTWLLPGGRLCAAWWP